MSPKKRKPTKPGSIKVTISNASRSDVNVSGNITISETNIPNSKSVETVHYHLPGDSSTDAPPPEDKSRLGEK